MTARFVADPPFRTVQPSLWQFTLMKELIALPAPVFLSSTIF
jgi:hypothetical protein